MKRFHGKTLYLLPLSVLTKIIHMKTQKTQSCFEPESFDLRHFYIKVIPRYQRGGESRSTTLKTSVEGKELLPL